MVRLRCPYSGFPYSPDNMEIELKRFAELFIGHLDYASIPQDIADLVKKDDPSASLLFIQVTDEITDEPLKLPRIWWRAKWNESYPKWQRDRLRSQIERWVRLRNGEIFEELKRCLISMTGLDEEASIVLTKKIISNNNTAFAKRLGYNESLFVTDKDFPQSM